MKRFLLLCVIALMTSNCARPSATPEARLVAELPPVRAMAWAPDGRSLLYVPQDNSPAKLLNLDRPDQPVAVALESTHSLVFSPDGRSVAYVCTHQGPQRPESSICIQTIPTGDRVDLFEGQSIIRGVSGTLRLERWLDRDTVAFWEHMGTGAQELRLVDIPSRKLLLPASPDYAATTFTWSADGRRVAGQRIGGPHSFWLWDRTSGQFIKPTQPLPGAQQEFEAWAPDGQAVLFTAWDGGFPYWDRTARATLYRWSLPDGRVEKLAENAGRAAWSGSQIAYVRLGDAPELVVAGLWSQPLGKLIQVPDGPPPWPVQPLAQGPYIAYAHSDGQWYVSPLAAKAPRPLAKGTNMGVEWAPDARHLAVQGGDPTRTRIFANPAQP